MKFGLIPVILLMLLVCSIPFAFAEDDDFTYGKPMRGSMHRISGGARIHDNLPGVIDVPLEKHDLSYRLMYEYHEGVGYWQMGASWTPSPDDERFEYVVTPEFNLILKDRIYRLGTGIMKSRVKTDDESFWTVMYWQVIAGIGIPLGDRFELGIFGHYVFKNWRHVTETDEAAIEGSALLSVSF